MFQIPSEVTVEKYLRVPDQDKVVESDDEWSRCGKWILPNKSGGMTWIDETWIKLQPLLKEGHLLMIKAPTAATSPDPNDPGIMCFTKPGEEEIERAAKEIRKAVSYEGSIYYKTNYMTENKIDHRYGQTNISCYMHTFKGFFYKKDPSAPFWTLVNGEETENHWKNSFSRQQWNTENFIKRGSAQLLSRSRNDIFAAQSKNKILRKLPCLSIHCSLEEVENTLSEADRLWIIGKKLIDQGIVYEVKCFKKSNVATVRFLVLKNLDKESLMELCDKIQEESQVFRFIVGKIGRTLYRYSPEKELEYFPDLTN